MCVSCFVPFTAYKLWNFYLLAKFLHINAYSILKRSCTNHVVCSEHRFFRLIKKINMIQYPTHALLQFIV
jgi:hypothetical protein